MGKPPSIEEIEEWTKRGFDPETVRRARERLALFEEGLSLIPAIEIAFRKVTLGSGVSLMETIALDDHADEETQSNIRAKDEKEDWQRICGTSLQGIPTFFFDAAGFRFHLPAFMCAHLRGEIDLCFLAPLTAPFSDLSRREEIISLLTPAQKSVFRQYLEFLLEDPPVHGSDIREAIKKLWV